MMAKEMSGMSLMAEDMYDVAREVTDKTLGEGMYAQINKDHPDPGVQAAIARWETAGEEDHHHIIPVLGSRTLLFRKGDDPVIDVIFINTVCAEEGCQNEVKGFLTVCPECMLESPVCEYLSEAEELAQAHIDLHLYGPPNVSS